MGSATNDLRVMTGLYGLECFAEKLGERKSRFGRAAYCCPGLTGGRRIDVGPLQALVFSYLSVCMSRYGTTLEGLPNVSQNRSLREFGLGLKERYLVDSLVADLLKSFDVSSWTRPSIRLISGKKDEWASSHPNATEKLHTDVWGGEPRGTMNILIPVFDSGVGCEFFEPQEDFRFEPLEDYNQGKDVKCSRLPEKLEVGRLTFFDSMCLHKTVREGLGYRISIDARGLYREQLPLDNSPWKPKSEYGA